MLFKKVKLFFLISFSCGFVLGFSFEHDLPPEYARALDKLIKTPITKVETEVVFSSDLTNGLYVNGLVKPLMIPHGQNWRWNQSQAKRCVSRTYGDAEVSIFFFKLLPKEKKGLMSGVRRPKHKLWVFHLVPEEELLPSTNLPALSFLWAERIDTELFGKKHDPEEEAFASSYGEFNEIYQGLNYPLPIFSDISDDLLSADEINRFFSELADHNSLGS